MICGAFLINKPNDAAFGGDGGGGLTAINCRGENCFLHAHKGQLRRCDVYDRSHMRCTDWLRVNPPRLPLPPARMFRLSRGFFNQCQGGAWLP